MSSYGVWTSEDVEQQAAMVALQGKTPSKAVIRRKFERQYLPPRYGVLVRMSVEGVATQAEELRTWAYQEGELAQEVIEWFLADPDHRLDEALIRLELGEPELPAPSEAKKRRTYAEMMFDALPATRDDLLAMLCEQPINRPDATLRAWLKRYQHILQLDSQDRYILKGHRPG